MIPLLQSCDFHLHEEVSLAKGTDGIILTRSLHFFMRFRGLYDPQLAELQP